MTDSHYTAVDQASNYDLQMKAYAHVSHFGALKTSSVIPVLKGNFAGSSLDTSLWDSTTANGGNVVVEDGVGKLNTSTASNGSVKLFSVRPGRFEAGQVTVYQSGVYAGAGVENNTRRWGLMTSDEQNGLFFEWSGMDFRVVARKGGTDTAVSTGSFNGGQKWKPGNANNTFRIFYSAGRAIFCRAQAGNIKVLHTMVDTDLPLVDDLDMGLYYENTNTGNTTDVELRVRGASSSVFGELSRYDSGGALLTADYEKEVALGYVSKHSDVTRFGRNADIDTGPEDIFAGSGVYAGTPTGSPETVEIFSSSANDTSAGTGTRTVRITGLLTSDSTSYTTEDLTLNGTTAVTSTNTWYRINKVAQLTAGSGETNAGTLTVRHTTTTANIFAQVAAGTGHSTIGAYTVPNNTTFIMTEVDVTMGRANGSAGSANVVLAVREFGSSAWNFVRNWEITNSIGIQKKLAVPLVINEKADVKFRCTSVSDANTIVTAELGGILVDD